MSDVTPEEARRRIRDYDSLAAQLEAAQDVIERQRELIGRLFLDPEPLTEEQLENLREKVGLPRRLDAVRGE